MLKNYFTKSPLSPNPPSTSSIFQTFRPLFSKAPQKRGFFFLKIKLLFALTQSNISKNVFSASFDNMFKAQ